MTNRLLDADARPSGARCAGQDEDKIVIFNVGSEPTRRPTADIRFLGRRRLESALRRLHSEAGQVAVLVAMVSVVLFSSLALAVDVGAGYSVRRVLQTSVDAAALAAAQDIAEQKGVAIARATAESYVADNVGSVGGTAVMFPDGNHVVVEASKSQTTFFARLFGRESFPVKATAGAAIGTAGRVDNLVPIIVPHQSVAGHIGEGNPAVFELGEDRPLDPLAITYSQAGSQVTYTVAFINTANKAVYLEMWSPVPPGATFTEGSATGGGTFDGTNVKWQWPATASGDSRTARFTVNFSGAVNPRNDVYARVNGEQARTASTSTSQRGFFWLVDFDGGSHGTPEFADWLVNGYPYPVGVGDLANGTGVRSALRAAMAERMASDPKVVLPLYDYTEGGGNGTYHVVGFAEFVITGFELNGNPKAVTGYFTNGTVTTGSPGEGNALDYGVKVIWLSD